MTKYFIYIFVFLVSISNSQSQSDQNQTIDNDKQASFNLNSSVIKVYIDISPESYKGVFLGYTENIYYPISIRLGNGDSLKAKMRVRGDSSREKSKKWLKIKLNKKNQSFAKGKIINLNAESSDPTYMRQYLASLVYNTSGQPSFRTNHVELYLNNNFQGVYLWIETMDKHFLSRNGLDPKGNLYKAKYDGATLSSHDDLYKNWEKKSNEKNTEIDDLVKLRNELNSIPDKDYYDWVKSTFDYDNVINSLAVNMLISNSSTYYHNYYLYHDLIKDKWHILPWDMDQTFKPNYIDMHYQRGSWAERKSAAMEGNPLLERAIINEKMLSDIKNRISELQQTVFNLKELGPIVDSLSAIIEPFIGKEKVVSRHPSFYKKHVTDLKRFIQERYDDLQKQFAQNPTSFRIDQPEVAFSEDILLSWKHSIDPNNDTLVYKVRYSKREDFSSGVREIKNIIGNKTIIQHEKLSPGKYFFLVSVSDGNQTIYGYHSKHYFWVIE